MPRTIWPATSAEQQDRRKVIDLVQAVGAARLRWTVRDLREYLAEMPHLQLTHSGQLARHVAALCPVTVTPVEQPLGALAEGGTNGGTRSSHLYVLTARLAEHAKAPPTLPESVRVYVALWVACQAAGVDAADTSAVTRVCRTIESLAVRDALPMNQRLATLADRRAPLVQREPAPGAQDQRTRRWQRWRPVGKVPALAELEEWVAVMQALQENSAPPSRVGHVTLHDIACEWVEIAVAHSASPLWPHGRSVTVSDIEQMRAQVPRAAQLHDLLKKRGTSLGKVLGDVTKQTIAGRPRVVRRVVKVGIVAGEQAYYDLPTCTGFEARSLIVAYQQLMHDLREGVLDELASECEAAERLRRHDEPPILRAIGAVRVLLAHRSLASLEERAATLIGQRVLLSQQAVERVDRQVESIRKLRHSIGEGDEVRRVADAAVRAVGAHLDQITGAPRPLLLGDDYAGWVPVRDRADRTGPQVLARATTLQRYPNPEHSHRSDSDPRRAAITGVDRVDALIYLAEKLGAKTLAFLRNGAELLGSTLREPTLPRLLLTVDNRRLRSRALAALALLGDSAAADEAHRILHDPQSEAAVVVNALYALAVLRAVNPSTWPAWLAQSQSSVVLRAMHEVARARTTGGWLL